MKNLKDYLIYDIYKQMEQDYQMEPIQLIQEELGSSSVLRFYLQEDAFYPHNVNSGGKFQLPFNQIAAEVMAEVALGNKLIASNSRLNSNFLENGRQIYKKKKEYFQLFFKEYRLIGQSLVYLPMAMRDIFENTVLALSNLILKLSINMSKISVVVITRMLTPSYLNIFMVSVLFEKFLERQLQKSQESYKTLQDYNNSLKMYPKTTIIKLSQRRNPYDYHYVRKSQNLFSPQFYNLQLIELFEEEQDMSYSLLEGEVERGQRFNLKLRFGIKAPYGMELYFFVNEILIEKMIQFKPDIVIFIDDLPCDKVNVDTKVKSLILNEISTRVQNKIYVFKEIGPTEEIRSQFLMQNRINLIEQMPSDFKKYIEAASKGESIYSSVVNNCVGQAFSQSLSKIMKDYIVQNSEVQMRISRQIIDNLNKLFVIKKLKPDQIQSLVPETLIIKMLKKMRKALLDDITSISLALIQKTSFEETKKLYRNYIFSSEFIGRLIQWLKKEKEIVDNSQTVYSDASERLKNKIDRLEGVKQMSIFRQSGTCLTDEQNCFSYFNLKTNKAQTPLYSLNGKSKRSLPILESDQIYIHYTNQWVLIFHYGVRKLNIFGKKHAAVDFELLREDIFEKASFLSARHSTLIANKRMFYKAFGQYQTENEMQSKICRINIQNPLLIKQKEWEIIQTCNMNAEGKAVKLKLQNKIWGWGQSLDLGQNNLIIFGGGFNFSATNQQRVNKFLYLIKNNDSAILRIGKVNGQLLNENENIKCKNMIYPFVFGVPLGYSKEELIVLNTNGSLEHLNHSKRLYLSKYRIPYNFTGISIVSQNKMDYGKEQEIAIANKNTIFSYINCGYERVNRFNGKNCFSGFEGENVNLNLSLSDLKQGKDKLLMELLGEERMNAENEQISVEFGTNRLILKDKQITSSRIKDRKGG